MDTLVKREEANLGQTKENADFVERGLHLEQAPNRAQVEIENLLKNVMRGLNPEEIDVLTRKMVLDDLMWTAEQGMELPFGFKDVDDITFELRKVNQYLKNRPDLIKRLEIRDAAKNKLRDAMVESGVLTEERVQNPHYFRHQILEYGKLKGYTTTGGEKLSTGFWHRRKGSEKDINVNYFQVEAEWMFKAHMDVATQNYFNWMRDSQYNHRKEFAERAKQDNNDNLLKVLIAEFERAAKSLGLSSDLSGLDFDSPIEFAKVINKAKNDKSNSASHNLEKIYQNSPMLQQVDSFRIQITLGMGEVRAAVEDISELELESFPRRLQGALKTLLGEHASSGLAHNEEDAPVWPLLSWLANNNDYREARDAATKVLAVIGSRQLWLKNKAIPDKYISSRDTKALLKAYGGDMDLVAWQPDSYDGKTRALHIFTAKTVPEHIVDRSIDRLVTISKEMQVEGSPIAQFAPEFIQGVAAIIDKSMTEQRMQGGPKEEFIISNDIATTLNDFHDEAIANTLDAFAVEMTRAWKKFILFQPIRFAKYSLRRGRDPY